MSTHSRLASDRYLHFPPNFYRANEYLSFSVNISSDNEEEEEEQNRNQIDTFLKDWIKIKAEEANIRLCNNFVSQTSGLSQQNKSQRVSWNHENEESVCTTTQEARVDIFNVVNRTFELTSFDHLLKEARTCKVVTLDGLNQTLFQTTSFMKMFKSPEPLKKYSSPPPLLSNPHECAASTTFSTKSASSNEEDDEDDEDDDEPIAVGTEIAHFDEHIQVDEDKNSGANTSLIEPYKQISSAGYGITDRPRYIGSKTTEILSLQSGLKSSNQVYSFEYQQPSEQDTAKYRRYAYMAQLNVDASTAVNDCLACKETTKPTLNSFCERVPMFEFTPSFFTVDSAFHTEINKVSDKSLEVYTKACSINLTSLEPSNVAKKLYAEHAV